MPLQLIPVVGRWHRWWYFWSFAWFWWCQEPRLVSKWKFAWESQKIVVNHRIVGRSCSFWALARFWNYLNHEQTLKRNMSIEKSLTFVIFHHTTRKRIKKYYRITLTWYPLPFQPPIHLPPVIPPLTSLSFPKKNLFLQQRKSSIFKSITQIPSIKILETQ